MDPSASRVVPEEGGSLPWYALHVRCNHEFKVRDKLEGQSVIHFLPSYEVRRRDGETVERPLLPGYIFARFDPRKRLPILQISGLLAILGDHSGPIAIADHEVDSLRQLAAAPTVEPHAPLTHGQRIRVKYGSYAGTEGFVEFQKGACRVVVNIAAFNRAVSIQFEREAVEAI